MFFLQTFDNEFTEFSESHLGKTPVGRSMSFQKLSDLHGSHASISYVINVTIPRALLPPAITLHSLVNLPDRVS